MTQTQNFIWDQGSDLEIKLIYKEGDTVETALPVDLSANYSLRMDLVVPGERVYTFNSAAIADVDPGAATTPDSVLETTLTAGAGGTPNINIIIPRSLTLPGGDIYAKMTATPSVKQFNYDIFLRNTSTDKQVKVLKGTVTVEESYTLWQ